MKVFLGLGSFIFVLGFFVSLFGGIPWAVVVADDPVVPLWLRIAVFSFLGGFLLVLLSLGLQQVTLKKTRKTLEAASIPEGMLLMNSAEIPGRKIKEVLGLVQGHTIFAIWLGKDLAAIGRLIVGGELLEYTEMMGNARKLAISRMVEQAKEKGADAVINMRYMTNSVVGSAAELMAYGTAVKLE